MRRVELAPHLKKQAATLLAQGIPRKIIARQLGVNPCLVYRAFPMPNPMLNPTPSEPEDDTDLDEPLTPEQQAKLAAIRQSIQPPGYRTCREIREMMRK